MLEYMATINQFLRAGEADKKGSVKKNRSITIKDCATPTQALYEFHKLVSSQLKVSLATLAVVIYCGMARDPNDLDYALPKPPEVGKFPPFANVIYRRSLGAAMAFEHHRWVFNNPVTYLMDNRVDHPLDGILL